MDGNFPREALERARCFRCGGLMVGDSYMDLMDRHSQADCRASRCVQCGEVVDPVILKNRSSRPLNDVPSVQHLLTLPSRRKQRRAS